MSEFSTIGKPVAFVDAAEKTTGHGKYTDDLSLPGMLIGKILHSPYPHARIRNIDTSRARALPGVVAVVSGRDAPTTYGILPIGHDEHALALDKVRYVGDNVACVAAVDEATAEKALELIDVDYELLPAWFDPEQSMKAEADFIHESRARNIEKEYHHTFGDPDKGFAEADYVTEARYIANEVTHAAMEPHSTLASFELDPHSGKPGRLTVWSSTQVPYYLQHKLSLVLDIPMSQIRVIKPLVGGGFGGKSEVIPLEITAAIAARAAGAPVKITYTREEVFWAHRGRPRTIIDLKMGAKKDGRVVSISARVIQDGGGYCSYGPVTILYSGALLGALYDIPNVRYDGYRVLTNKPACGAMRGHGTVNVRFAFESQLDEVAAALKLDPADVRRCNLLKPPCVTVNGLRVLSYGLPECIEKVVAASRWDEKRSRAKAYSDSGDSFAGLKPGTPTGLAPGAPTKLAPGAPSSPITLDSRKPMADSREPRAVSRRRGLGLACSHYVSGAANSIIRSDMPHSTVNIKVDRDGGVVVYTGASEIGQGSDTMVAQIVAEVLGCDLARVKVIAADTDLTPIDLGSYSSRVTFMNGNASLRAAEDVKKKIAAAAARKLNCAAGDVVFRGDKVFRKGVIVGAQAPLPAHSTAAEILESRDTPRGSALESERPPRNAVKVQGRVEGQTLRGSVQQKRKEEGPKDVMTFEEAVVAAIDFSGALTGTGSYAPPPEARGGQFKGSGVGPSPAYSYSAQVAEVSVDEDTGEVTVHKIWAAHDCGRALNPVAVEGQVIGSVWMGLGQALEEEMIWKDGLLMNPGMLEYRSPSAAESPEIECFIVESIDPEGPFGAKEAGEGSLAATIPAISNAIYDAVGIRLREAPFTPERILAALRAKNGNKKLNMTRDIDPTAPATFPEHGGSLWFKGKGPTRHPADPSRTAQPAAEVGGDD